MKKKSIIKNLLAYALAVLVIIGSVPIMSASADVDPVTGEEFVEEYVTDDGLEYAIVDGEVTITGYKGAAEEFTIPSEIDGYPVTSIDEGAFQNCNNITSITISDNVKCIGDKAFYYCENLQRISISDSVEEVGSQAFDFTGYYNDENNWDGDFLYIDSILVSSKYSSIENYSIKEGTRVIAENAFVRADSNLKSITIPQSTIYIASSNGYVDYKIAPGAGFDYIAYGVFGFGLGNLKEFIVDKSNESFMSLDGVLVDKKTSEILRYPSGLETTEYSVPDEITGIRGGAFYGADFVSVIIPESVTSINETAFKGSGYNTDNLTIFGYVDSCAETFANEMGISFIAIREYTDADSDISVEFATDDEVELSITEVTDADLIAEIDEALANQVADKVYDITLTQGNEKVQPEGAVTVKIPSNNENSKVYRVEGDKSLTDMHAEYQNGYMVFTTEHFSLYVLAVEDEQESPTATVTETATSEPPTTIPHENMVLMGDVDLDESVNIKDATLIQKNVAGLTVISDMATFAANVIATDILNIKDATAIQKWVASLVVDVVINEYVPYNESVQIPSDPEETTTASVSGDAAVISCGGTTYTAKVGDAVTYSVLLSAEEKFEDIEGSIRFDGSVLSPVNEDIKIHCPNLYNEVTINQDTDNSVIFVASNGYRGFDFKSEKLLVTYSFIVLSAENTEITLDIDTMTIFGGESYYFDEGKAIVTKGIRITETIAVS